MLLKGKPVAESLIQSLEKQNLPRLTLAVLHPTGDASAESYLKAKEKTLARLNFKLEVISCARSVASEQFCALIDKVNRDPAVHGVMVETPFPSSLSATEVFRRLDPVKDVDGVSLFNQGILYATREERLVPCTAMAAILLLEHYGVEISGRRALVVGRSTTVGLPLAKLLLNRNATVTVAHSKTEQLASLAHQYNLVAVAAGRSNLLRAADVADGTVVVDVGVNVMPDGTLCGDFAPEGGENAERISYSPVPGGVGVVTNAVLLHNLVMCYRLQKETGR